MIYDAHNQASYKLYWLKVVHVHVLTTFSQYNL